LQEKNLLQENSKTKLKEIQKGKPANFRFSTEEKEYKD
jgi:hypothetical protein